MYIPAIDNIAVYALFHVKENSKNLTFPKRAK